MEAQILDADCVQVGTPDASWARRLRANDASYLRQHNAKEYPKNEAVSGASYVVRLWCRCKSGASLCVSVVDPWATSYIKLKEASDPTLECLAQKLQTELSRLGVAEVSVVRKRTTSGFRVDPATLAPRIFPWLRVRVGSAFLRNHAMSKLARLQRALGLELCLPERAEARVEVHSELLEGLGLRPGGWLCLSSDVQITRGEERVFTHLHAQAIRAQISCGSEACGIAPVRVLSWDIECYSAAHAFPLPENPEDRIISIGACARTFYGEREDEDLLVITLKDVGAAAVEGEPKALRFVECADEAAVLKAFAEAIQQSDADVLVGYNTCGFDWRYINSRIEKLVENGEIPSEASATFYRFGRMLSGVCTPQEMRLSSSAMGDNPLCYPRTPGRFGVDLWLYLKLEDAPELPNLKLNTVALHYLKSSKIDLPAKQIFAEFERAASGRRLVAVYCCQDCLLVLDLVQKLCVVPRLLEMAKVTGTIPEDLLYRGQQIKVYTQLLAAAHEKGEYVVEDIAPVQEESGKYQGAHVEEPVQGYYTDPILTVDFASLYPSLMRTYNLSPDTLLAADSSSLVPHCVVEVEAGRELRFVAPFHCRGLLPRILDSLLQERQRTKREMAAESCAFRRELLNAKQLALKKSANSVYGACGSAKGLFHCRAVAEATTSAGRKVISFTKKIIEQDFRIRGCSVVYGDSVTGDTPLVVRVPGEPWRTCRIDALVTEAQWAENTREGKEEVCTNLEVWTAGGFTRLLRVVRHFTKKPVVRVHSPFVGVLDCTEDHSLMLSTGCAAAPAAVKNSESLLRAEVCKLPCEGDVGAHWPRVYGVFFRAGSCGSSRWRVECGDAGDLQAVREALEGKYSLRAPNARVLLGDDRLRGDFRALFYNSHGEKRVPACILNAAPSGQRSFLHACLGAERFIEVTNKEAAAGIWILGRKLGYIVTMRQNQSRWRLRTHLFTPRVPVPLRAEFLSCSAQYVYDVETEQHHFHAGPGEMVAHNTDSAFVRLPPEHRQDSPRALFDIGEELAQLVTSQYKLQELDPSMRETCVVSLEMEKYLRPLILYKKKRYVGVAFESAEHEGKLLTRGLELVRRDAVPLVKRCEADVLEALLKRHSVHDAVACVERALRVLAELRPGGPFGIVAMSKSLRGRYVNPEGMAHVKVAELMNERDPGSAPRVGDRVEYVVVASSSPRVVDRAEDVAYAEAHGLAPDWHFYVKALEKPLMRVLEVPLTSIDASLYGGLLQTFKDNSHDAAVKCRRHGKVRHGATWIHGHACKTGPPQLKLCNFFSAASAPCASSSSASGSSPAPELPVVLAPRAEAVPAVSRGSGNKRSVLEHLQSVKHTRARQTTL